MRHLSPRAAPGLILTGAGLAAPIAVAAVLSSRTGVPQQWQIIAVLVAIATTGLLAGRWTGSLTRSAPQPWNVHTIWLVPGVLLTPPPAFAVLVALSLAATLLSGKGRLRFRLLVATNNLLGCALVYVAVATTPTPRAALFLGIPLLLAVTAVVATAGSRLLRARPVPGGFSDLHWIAIESCAALTGALITVAMTGHPMAGLAGIAPMVLAVFALRWPELTSQARTDVKTGLPNAGRWEELSRQALNDCALRQRPAALLIIDIDHFKNVNDSYGHLAGDGILAAVAAAIRSELGQSDLVGRFGGEEFVVTTVGLSQQEALVLAERIRQRIAATRHEVTTRDGVRVTADPVTCTIGVASSELLGYGHTLLLRRADAALAGGKIGGRDQVRSAQLQDSPDWHPIPESVDQPAVSLPAPRSLVPAQRQPADGV